MIRFTLPANLFRAVHNNAAVDDARHYLCGYHLKRCSADDAYLEGTDGHALVRLKFKLALPVGFESAIIPRYTMRVLKSTATVVVEIASNGNTLIALYNLRGKLLATDEGTLVDGKFPDTDRVIPDEFEEDSGMPTFNTDLVHRTASALNPHCPMVTIKTVPGQDCLVSPFSVEFPWLAHETDQGPAEVLCIVMPARRS